MPAEFRTIAFQGADVLSIFSNDNTWRRAFVIALDPLGDVLLGFAEGELQQAALSGVGVARGAIFRVPFLGVPLPSLVIAPNVGLFGIRASAGPGVVRLAVEISDPIDVGFDLIG